ncbi:protein FAM200A-like [Ascaphus truei]|uniref:protein FAM200A-like n=1 Tax=Ascaphus truei TaxID=8439 RepID=UPI003F5A9335
MAEDLNDQLIEKIKGKEFGLKLDEATDNNKDAHFICYVRFIDGNDIVEDLLFCKTITAGTKAQDLFEILTTFIVENNLEWTKCVGVCTDGGHSMSGRYGGLQALIRKKAPYSMWTHCIIHREALASKYLSPPLNMVLERVVNVVNFINIRPLKATFFKKLCEDMGAEYTYLLYYCLSRGNFLSRTFQLRQEIYIFLEEEKHEYANHFVETEFLVQLAYLCDIFDKLNALNLSLQGGNMHILTLAGKISAFRKKLLMWRRNMNEDGGKDCFPFLQQFVIANEVDFSKSVFEDHLSQVIKWFEKYFQEEDDIDKFAWIQDPFKAQPPPEFTCLEEENLIELSCDNTLKTKFGRMDITEFWLSVKDEYLLLSGKAQRIPFATSYLCEAGFSAVGMIKANTVRKSTWNRK